MWTDFSLQSLKKLGWLTKTFDSSDSFYQVTFIRSNVIGFSSNFTK